MDYNGRMCSHLRRTGRRDTVAVECVAEIDFYYCSCNCLLMLWWSSCCFDYDWNEVTERLMSLLNYYYCWLLSDGCCCFS